MAYLISIGSTVCGTTAIMATAPVIGAKKNEVSYAIANITLFGILSMLIYPYFANFYFESEPLLIGLFLGTSIHETSQVAAAGLIYDQQFNSPETLNIATVTKLIRNTFLIIMIPLFAFLYNRGKTTEKKYSIIDIFPYFVLGFVAMIIIRNLGDLMYSNNYKWLVTIEGPWKSGSVELWVWDAGTLGRWRAGTLGRWAAFRPTAWPVWAQNGPGEHQGLFRGRKRAQNCPI